LDSNIAISIILSASALAGIFGLVGGIGTKYGMLIGRVDKIEDEIRFLREIVLILLRGGV
jgi:hypothetical protein